MSNLTLNTVHKNNIKKCYVLFETDIYKSVRSRVFLGVFTSHELAVSAAKQHDCYSYENEVVVLEVELDKFEEV